MEKKKLEVGKLYDVFSSRKGNFTMKLIYQDETFATGVITKGKAKVLLAYNEVEKGQEVTVRKELTVFKLID